MKAFKKFFALLMAMLMTMSMLVTTAMADDPYDITITTSAENHTYEAYQIFTGEVRSDGVVSSIDWGNALPEGKRNGFITDLKADSTIGKYFTGEDSLYADAKQIGTVLGGWSYNEDPVQAFADVFAKYLLEQDSSFLNSVAIKATAVMENGDFVGKYKFDIDEAGYYFIKETTTDECTDGITDHLILISGANVNPKNSMPTFDMSVNYRADGTYHDYVDVEIGAPVYIKLEASLPSLYEDYNQYYLAYEAELPSGMDFIFKNTNGEIVPSSAIEEMYLLHASGYTTDLKDLSSEYSVTLDTNKKTLRIDFDNIRDVAVGANPDTNKNDKIVVKLKAGLNGAAIFGVNSGESINTLGNEINARMVYSNDMNKQAATGGQHWTQTISHAELTDKASVYTYQIQFQKQDSADKKPLANADFRLYRTVTTEVDNNGTKTTVNTDYYAKFEFINDVNTGLITGWEVKSTNPSPDTLLTSSAESGAESGTFFVKGLDSLAYSLEEVDAPDGYNQMEQPVSVTISVGFTGKQLTNLSAIVDSNKVNGTPANGLISTAPIYNTLGSTLPATGGIGTTIFYIVGGVLVLGAGAAFVMKRRNEA